MDKLKCKLFKIYYVEKSIFKKFKSLPTAQKMVINIQFKDILITYILYMLVMDGENIMFF